MTETAGGLTLIVARHGRTTWNAEGRFQGQGDPPLDEVGRAQAAALASAIVRLSPTMVVSSDLRRAIGTAEPLAARCGLRLRTDPGLREVDLGRWEGLERGEAERRFPDEYRAWTAGEDIARGGGETVEAAGRRAARVIVRSLGEARAARPDLSRAATVVVVAHGIVLQAALTGLAGVGTLTLPYHHVPHLENGAWLVLPVAESVTGG